MILKIFSILDTKTDAYSKPFFCLTTGEAIRTFTDAVNDPQSPFAKHPYDYILFEIGNYDDATAIVSSITPTNLGNAAEYKSENEPTLIRQEA